MDQYPLSLSQRRLWLLGNEGRRSIGCVVEIAGAPDPARLQQSIRRLVDRHSILRTVYPLQAGFSQPFQSILDDTDYFGFTVMDRIGEGLTIETIMETYFPAKTVPHGPLLQIELIRLEPASSALVVLLPALSTDGASLLRLIQELQEAYARGDEFDSHNATQHFHFSEWHNALIRTGNKEADDFWKRYHHATDQRLSLSFSLREEETGRNQPLYTVARTRIDATQTAALHTLASACDIDAGTVLMACFAILLQRHSKQEKIIAGRVNNRRGYEELEGVIGPLARILPLDLTVNGETGFQTLLSNIQEEWERVTAWEDYFHREPTAPHWQWLFEYHSAAAHPARPGCPSFATRHLDTVCDHFDLKCSFLDDGNTIQLCIYTDTTAIHEGAAAILADQYCTLLQFALAAPGTPVDQLSMLSEMAEERITREFNPGFRTAVPAMTIPTAFERITGSDAEAIAVRFRNSEWTYRQLDEKANQIAHHLRQVWNIRAGDTVALRMPRSADWIAAMLGILKTGACYLPVDPQSPVARISFILEDSGAKGIITDRELRGLPSPQLLFGDAATEIAQQPTTPVDRTDDLSTPVYIIYTSGSTGSPKGVAVGHSSLLNYSRWFTGHTGLAPHSHTLLLSSPAFDLCYTSLWVSLLSGHMLSILEESTYLDTGDLLRHLADDGIDYIKCTPSHFNMLLHEPGFETGCLALRLSLIVLGGEEIVVKDLETWLRRRPETRFLHHYGPTETTIGTIAKLIFSNEVSAFGRKPVLGRPVTNSSIYILDPQGRPCPIGCTGEIAVAGKGLAIGYVNAPDLSRRKFVPNSFGDGDTMYLTGDLGRWMPDGTVEFLGRTDHQLKLRGYRVEPGEIENAILKNERIRNAVVLPIRKEDGDISLTACMVSAHRPEIAQLTDLLSSLLPAYMIPDRYIWVDTIPLTANGKADKKLLAELAAAETPEALYIPPVTMLEKKLALLWTEILGRERIGLNDDFFRLGGHSLKATQLISRIFKVLGYRIRLSDVFQHPQLGRLAAALREGDRAKYDPILPAEPAPDYPLSHAQRRLWLLDQLGEHELAYNMHFACWIDGGLDRPALEKALESVIRRHEILRTSFPSIDGVPRQRIHAYEDGDFGLRYHDLRQAADPRAVAVEYSANALNQSFSLAAGPVMRTTLLQRGDDNFAFLLTLHHIVSDGWSMRIMMNEILAAYNGFISEPLAIQYRDYTVWHNRSVAGADEAYWNQQLKNAPGLANLPSEKFRRGNTAGGKPYTKRQLDEEATVQLKELAAAHRSTLSNVMLTVYALLIHKITGETDLLIGMGHANRNHADVERLIGFFVNLLPIRIRIDEETTIGQAIDEITATCIGAFDHADYPFDLLVEKFSRDRYSTRQPLVNVMYDFKGYSDLLLENEPLTGHGLQIRPMPSLRNDPKFDLTLFVSETDDCIEYYFEYDHRLFSTDTITRFFKGFDQLIGLILEKEAVSY